MNTPIWLGAYDIEKEANWVWQSEDEEMEYERFQPGEPNGGVGENCLEMSQENGDWSDNFCIWTRNYHVCEKETSQPVQAPIKEGLKFIFF